MLDQPDTFPSPFEGIIEARQSLWDAAFTRNGDPTFFCDALKIFGPVYLLYHWNTLFALHFLRERAKRGDEYAKKILEKVGKALSWISRGQTSTLTNDQKVQRQRGSLKTSKHKTQAAKAANRAKTRFLSETKDLSYDDPEYPKRAWIIADDVAKEAFSEREEETKAIAEADYWSFVKSLLPPRPKPAA
jgi:hypothetical protein